MSLARLLLMFLLLSIAACAKSPNTPRSAGKPAQNAATDANAAAAQPDGQGIVRSPKTITLAREQQQYARSASAPTRPVVVPDRPSSGVSALLAADRERRTLPEDFKIGPLADASDIPPRAAQASGADVPEVSGESADEEAALNAAVLFLGGLATGTVDRKLLAPDSEPAVSDFLGFNLERGYSPKSFRVGKPKKNASGEIAANVRLFGADGTSEGEIFMKRVSRQWLVSDLQISMAQLAVKREKPKERFFPGTYRWLLGE